MLYYYHYCREKITIKGKENETKGLIRQTAFLKSPFSLTVKKHPQKQQNAAMRVGGRGKA